jgi:flagellar protein FlaG
VQAKPVVQAQPAASAEAARQAAERINEFLKSSSANVEFSVDTELNQVVVRVVDSETHELIRQVPTEETLAISHALDRLTGLLLAQKA